MRTPYIAGNWKMHKTASEAEALARDLVRSLDREAKKVMIAPAFTALGAVKRCLEGSHILLGAQNMGPEEQGAHTGEVSVLMLKDLGVEVVILGHSERRHKYGEGDELINQKVKLAVSHGLDVVLCVGETLEQRDSGTTTGIVEEQLRRGLNGLGALAQVTIAYEPVWAIGTGKTATAKDADDTHRFIRELLARLYNQKEAEEMIIQYGGSVKPNNAAELMAMENIDGLLVGGASLTADSFVPIVRYDAGS
ncbi:MAG: triose-phosphate isomerase [Spirochaetaceae bacterium]|nr:MAG: triose-phosphate isomerase [Spirochaetaceae bacterium]